MSHIEFRKFIIKNGFKNCKLNEQTGPGTLLCAFFALRRRANVVHEPLFTFDDIRSSDKPDETEVKIVTVISAYPDFKWDDDVGYKRYLITILEESMIFWARHNDLFYQKHL